MSETSEDSEIFMDAVEDSSPLPSPPINHLYDDDELYPLHRAIFENKSIQFLNDLLQNFKIHSGKFSDPEKKNEKKLLEEFISKKDLHGNTALHLAIMLGHRDQINFLLKLNSPIKSKNLQGWTPLDEAISYGDRKIITIILKMGRKQARQSLENRSKLIETLKLIKDFQMEIRWEFYSWLPFLKKHLPSDLCRIYKKGSQIRCDSTLLDFKERGDITFLFNGEKKSSDSLVILDNELKVFQFIRFTDHMDLDEDIDLLMSSDLAHHHMSTKSIQFQRAQAGWFFARYARTEKVGRFEADFYNINGLTLITRKRREHLSDEDIQTNKQLLETLKKSLDSMNNKNNNKKQQTSSMMITSSSNNKKRKSGGPGHSFDEIDSSPLEDGNNDDNNDDGVDEHKSSNGIVDDFELLNANNDDNRLDDGVQDDNDDNDGQDDEDEDLNEDLAEVKAAMISVTNGPIKRRKSLPPPPSRTDISWEDYLNAPKGQPPCLGRQWKLKESSRTFKATVAMSQEFPMTIESLMNVLELITQFNRFKKLKEFVNLNLPPGFPVKIDIPFFPTILARITFQNFQFNDNLDDHLFEIPMDFTEDPNRFPEI